ncbi:MAG TPA: hypothetical protein VD883_01895, partial [Candidatus Omnitrophota bacterium]|nr:hypothetical protein [Candidatus Omnitrophota bacterium]
MSKTGGKCFATFILATTCLALTAVFLRPALAEDSSWKLKRDKEGIQVFARKMNGHLVREYRGITIVRAPLAEVIALYENTARTPEWMYMCREFKELKENGPDSKVFYFRQGLTRPASDRDAVISRLRTEDPLTQTVTYVLSQTPD